MSGARAGCGASGAAAACGGVVSLGAGSRFEPAAVFLQRSGAPPSAGHSYSSSRRPPRDLRGGAAVFAAEQGAERRRFVQRLLLRRGRAERRFRRSHASHVRAERQEGCEGVR